MLQDKKKYLSFIRFSIIISLFFSLLSGCALFPSKIPLVINKYDGEGKMQLYKTINGDKKIKEVKKVLNDTKWENSNVEMGRSPDYTFYFDDPNAKAVGYNVWVTPNKKQIEIIEGTDRYSKLTKKDSAIIFSIFELK